MTCTTCGTENRPGAKFCTECGSALAAGCPSCGTVNPAGAKFCSECATPLQSGARPVTAGGVAAPQTGGSAAPASSRAAEAGIDGPVAERRLVSVLFADLVGFTPFAEGRDAEEVREVLSRYFDIASAVINRYGGTVEKFIGDAVMAVWGAPIAREDDAERAVRAALELVDAVPALSPGIQARAGVLTGEAAVTLGKTNEGMVAGDLVNTAARLQSAAAPGMVLVGETTQRAAAGAIAFEGAGEQVLKGKQSPVPSWRALRVVAERGGRGRSEALEAPFVGRDDELRLLKDLFHATEREGRSRLISVIGPGGIGKTRLTWEFQKYGDGLVEGVWWHAGRSPAYGDGVTFWALGEMVRMRSGLAESDDEATTRDGVAATVRTHFPDESEARWVEAALLALLGVGGTGAPIGSNELFAAWRTFFERLASTSPVVMVFEDLHHADSGLLDFIDHLMEWSRAVPITVITLARPELLERRPDWGAGKRAFTSVYLEPLAPADMERLLAGLVPGLPQTAIDRIVARADGIPLYAVETVRMLLAQGQLVLEGDSYRPTGPLDDLAVPETLTALIAARLDSLDAADRALIEDAAVLGQSFTVAGLAAVSGQPAEDLESRLRNLVRRELLVLDVDPRSPERGQYAFVQALIREVAYNTLARKDRKARHLAAARHFESLATDELAGGLAGHYLAAQRLAADEEEASALAAQARIALRGAAERASALGAYEQARTFLDQAIEVTTDPADRGELHERAFRASLQILEAEPILRHGAAIESEYRQTGDREAIARGVAYHALSYNVAGADPAAALAMLLKAWEDLSDLEETSGGVQLMMGLARAYRGLADNQNALLWTDRYLPIAERLNDLEPIARGIQGRGISLAATGRPREGLILLRGSHQLALANDLRDVELGSRILLSFYEQWGDPAAGLALGREGLEVGQRLGARSYGFQMVGNASVCALRVGEWDWVAAILDEWIEGEADDKLWIEFRVDRALLNAHRGLDTTEDIETAERRLVGVTDPQFESYILFARATTALLTGDSSAAIELAERSANQTSYFLPLAIPLASRAALWAGDAATARRLLELPALAPFWGPVLDVDRTRLAAGIAALQGRASEALSGFLEALRAYEQLGLPFEEAACAVDLAVLLPGIERESPLAAAAIQAARERLAGLGAAPFLARLDRVSDRNPGSRATSTTTPRSRVASGSST
ncbi:MAG TPA: adenylate/guanylate cyclase domain-containing protein [Candidatus Limnocylindria bacterium]|nr:adenylate/guanylate cyclase domain-containing protein [Candidatus Limnocylindria bacterium]